MQNTWRSVRRAVIVGVVMVGLAGAVQASPVAAEGESAAARACQDGGYSSLVGVQDGQITTFGTTGECVSYAARGGRLVAASVVQPCLNGGYADLATSEDNTTPFSSEAACVSYAAGGGTLVPAVDPNVLNPVFDFATVSDHGGYACKVVFQVSGLAPRTLYTFDLVYSDGEVRHGHEIYSSSGVGWAVTFFQPDGRTFRVQIVSNGQPIGSPSELLTASC